MEFAHSVRFILLAIPHGFAGVQQDRAPQVGLFFIFLDIKAIGSAPDFPVNMTQIIARRILSVRCKFNCKTIVGTAMLARDETFHDQACPHIHTLYPVKDLGIKEVFCRYVVRHGNSRHSYWLFRSV